MMIAFILFTYVLIGAVICSCYYYLNQSSNPYDFDEDVIFCSVLTGLFWPVVAPFAFGILLARYIANGGGRRK